MFRDVIVRLRGQFRCLTLDFPGCGLSPDAPGHDHSVRANARILEGFIDALDLQDITMAVHDVGGPLGFLTAARRPQRFRALVISNTFGISDGHHFPFNDDPDAYAAAISAWWAEKVAAAGSIPANA